MLFGRYRRCQEASSRNEGDSSDNIVLRLNETGLIGIQGRSQLFDKL